MFDKYYIIYFLVLSFVNVSISLQPGPVPFSARRTDLIESQSCEQSGWSCKDCSTLQSCGPGNIFKYQISCGDQFPDRPYCDPRVGRCVSDRHVCTEMQDPEFKCPGIGIYPDLTDCRRYISCRAKGEVGLIYSCLFQSVYNPVAKRCITNSYCYDPLSDCNAEYKTMAYKPDPSLYIVCRGDQKPLIKDCGSKILEYDSSLLACDFKCKEEGRFAHPTNNSLFYICIYNDDKIVRMMGLCREGTIYDEFYNTCVHQLAEITTEPATDLETVTEDKTVVDNNDQNLETTNAVNDEQNSEAFTENIETTIDNKNVYETTITNQDFETNSTVTIRVSSEITTENIFETTVDNINQNLETTTAANEVQNSEAITEIIEEGTTDFRNDNKTTTNNQDFQTTKTTSSTVLISNGPETSTENTTKEHTTTENIITRETTTISNGLEESNTTSSNESSQGSLTTISNEANVTNSSEESLETVEENNTHEETDATKEIDSNEDNTKEDEETDSAEQTEETKETKEMNSNEDENSNRSSQKTEEKDKSDEESKESNESDEKSNKLKDKKRKCIGRICLPIWKIPGFSKRNN